MSIEPLIWAKFRYLPTGFIGVPGVDIKPNSDGLNITADSPARDAGATLDAAYDGSINSVTRPSGAGWDIGAYEFTLGEPELELHGSPGDGTVYLNWNVAGALPRTSTWRIDYGSETGTTYLPFTDIVSSTRAYTLTGLTNYVWYTVTLNAVLESTVFLTDTVRVMPTDRFEYLPLLLKRY
jgi:hypothetical protein